MQGQEANVRSAIVPEEECGISTSKLRARNSLFRIVGGSSVPILEMKNNVPIHGFPWMVRLSKTMAINSQYCGGTLISRKHVLTAAHCMITCTAISRCKAIEACTQDELSCRDAGFGWATLGDYDRHTTNQGELYRKIKGYIIHPKTIQARPPDAAFLYDYAIAILNECVHFTHNVQPVCLPKSDGATYEGKTVTAIGWGSMKYMGKRSYTLQHINIKVFSDTECRKISSIYNSSNLMCAGDPINWKKDACQGDSGGKQMVNVLCFYQHYKI